MAFVPVHVLPSLAMLLFIAAVAPAVRREVRAAGDALPSRYKGTWPALRAKRQEDARAGVASGSVLVAAVVHEAQTLADAVPHLRTRWRRNAAWRRLRDERRWRQGASARAMGLPPDGMVLGAAKAAGRALNAGAARVMGAAGLKQPEEKKLQLKRKDVAVRRHARRAGVPAVVQLAYLTGNVAASTTDAAEAAERDAFWRLFYHGKRQEKATDGETVQKKATEGDRWRAKASEGDRWRERAREGE
jgi:hypothetical protein